ncbi:hypothetical protein [Lewinella sp. IMCC34183]|uniref:hypothetical protein n=1 Tax=Lewinella sp. IMCC34183 TaxID=2248762 RepID=UPI001300AAB2|nr:hypothetical protein [Lewinella sp. IMCC34183]
MTTCRAYPLRFLTVSLTVLCLCACGGPEPSDDRQPVVPEAEAAEEALPPVPETDPTLADTRPPVTNTQDPIDWIRERYSDFQRIERDGQLDCDTVTYECPGEARFGSFVFCYSDVGLTRITHEMTLGDHFGVTESYFYDGEELYFAHLTQGAWSFGGPPRIDEAGNEVPGTIDEVHEERRYYDQGALIQRLFKDYTITSGQSSPGPDEIPNRPTGEGVTAGLGSEAVFDVSTAYTYDCP